MEFGQFGVLHFFLACEFCPMFGYGYLPGLE